MTDSNKGLHILIVEDDADDQYLLTELLRASVIKIQLLHTAETLAKAIDCLQNEIFDIIFLDLFLPDSSGIDTFEALKEHTGKIPVIILSGLNDMDIAVEAISLGAQDYHIKGELDKKTLAKTILYSIERKHKLENLREDNERYISISKAELKLEESYKAIRKLTAHLQNIREEERSHIAREIHDELGQQLTILKMDLSWINKKIGIQDEPVKARMKELLIMLDEAVKSVRRISSELRPSLLDDLGLTAAMEWQLTEFEKRFKIKTHFKPGDTEIKLPESIKTPLFRIFQESLTNVALHSKAKKVTVSLSWQNGLIVLSVVDNGVGFDKQNTIAKKALGILGMQERTLMIGGAYEISGNPGKGTRVVVSIPFL